MKQDHVTSLQWNAIAPHSELHAAMFAVPPNRPVRILPHTHADFCEFMLILGGEGEHLWNGNSSLIHTGDLFFLGPRDTHTINAGAGTQLHWINIAFPLVAWQEFQRFLSAGRERGEIMRGVHRVLDGITAAQCTILFEETLHGFVAEGGGSRLTLARFLSEALPFLEERKEYQAIGMPCIELPTTLPPWLKAACTALLRNDNGESLRQGMFLLRERAGVSATHLARAFQRHLGQTPTEWITEQRLRHAAVLLTVTARPIADIAGECGFNELG